MELPRPLFSVEDISQQGDTQTETLLENQKTLLSLQVHHKPTVYLLYSYSKANTAFQHGYSVHMAFLAEVICQLIIWCNHP